MDSLEENSYLVKKQSLIKKKKKDNCFFGCLHPIELNVVPQWKPICIICDLWIKCRLLINSRVETVFPYLLPEEPFSVVQDILCMWGDVTAGSASADICFEVLWVLAKKSIMGIYSLKAEALLLHV